MSSAFECACLLKVRGLGGSALPSLLLSFHPAPPPSQVLILQRLTIGCHHICRYHGITLKDGRLCIVMHLYPMSLAGHLAGQPEGKLALNAAMNVARDIAKGLIELHGLHVRVWSSLPTPAAWQGPFSSTL